MTEGLKAHRILSDGAVFLDHTSLSEADLEWLSPVERLTLWNVKVAPGLLSRLTRLWWLDWRGGGVAQGLHQIQDCSGLRYLSLNQIRGLGEVGFIKNLTSLEMVNLYGLASLSELPSFRALCGLKRLQIGQMKALTSIGPAVEAPNLEELQLHNLVCVTATDLQELRMHRKLRAFEWFGENIPDRMWVPVRDALSLPKTRPVHPDEWFGI